MRSQNLAAHADRRLWITTLILLIAAVAIFSHVAELTLWEDELYSVHHASGTLAQIFLDREHDWPPGYYLPLYVWMRLVGMNDVAVHVLGALSGMLAAAFFFRAGRRLHSMWTGWLATLAFATSNYALYFILEVRGYTLVLLFSALALWMHLRWLEKPGWRRAVPYALALIGLLYSQYAGVLIVVLFAGHVLIAAPRRVPAWLGIAAAVAVAYLPMWSQFIGSMRVRSTMSDPGSLPGYFLHGPEEIYQAYSAGQDGLLAVILVLAAGGLFLLLRRGTGQRWAAVLWLAAWGVGAPVAAYLVRERVPLYTGRYLMWTMPGAFLLLALGLSSLPRRVRQGAVVLILVLALAPWQPFHFRPSYSDTPPARDLIRWLATRFEPGDALVVDPGCSCGDALLWWYYESLYFPGGGPIPRADDPASVEGSVWYLSRQGRQDEALKAAVQQGRVQTEFWGPWYFIAEHYEAPPLRPGYRLGEAVRFQGYRLEPRGPYRPGDTLRVESWWAVDEPLNRDYSISLQVVDRGGRLVAQSDSGPVGGFTPPQTSAWQPGRPYRDDRTIQLPWGLPMSDYELRLVVYYWEDGQRLAPEDEAPQRDGSLLLETFRVVSWAANDL